MLIAYTFFNELLGVLVRTYPNFSFFNDLEYSYVNDIIYNIYSIVFFGYFYMVYYKLASSQQHKKWIKRLSGIVLLTYLGSCFFQNPLDTNLFYAHAVASWVLLILIYLYFKSKKSEVDSPKNKHNLMFWVSVGLFSFYLVFPFLFIIGYLRFDLWEKFHLRALLRIFILIMYCLFCTGFVMGRRRAFG